MACLAVDLNSLSIRCMVQLFSNTATRITFPFIECLPQTVINLVFSEGVLKLLLLMISLGA